MAFGLTLRRLRIQQQGKVSSIAAALGVTRQYVGDVERERRPAFTTPNIIRAATCLGVDPTPLLAAAAADRGVFVLPIGDEVCDVLLMRVGAELVRSWAGLRIEQVEAIARALGVEDAARAQAAGGLLPQNARRSVSIAAPSSVLPLSM